LIFENFTITSSINPFPIENLPLEKAEGEGRFGSNQSDIFLYSFPYEGKVGKGFHHLPEAKRLLKRVG